MASNPGDPTTALYKNHKTNLVLSSLYTLWRHIVTKTQNYKVKDRGFCTLCLSWPSWQVNWCYGAQWAYMKMKYLSLLTSKQKQKKRKRPLEMYKNWISIVKENHGINGQMWVFLGLKNMIFDAQPTLGTIFKIKRVNKKMRKISDVIRKKVFKHEGSRSAKMVGGFPCWEVYQSGGSISWTQPGASTNIPSCCRKPIHDLQWGRCSSRHDPINSTSHQRSNRCRLRKQDLLPQRIQTARRRSFWY